MDKKIVIFIDGGSRGNPGLAALGVVFSTESHKELKKYSQFIGLATNNEAEYQSLIFALKTAKAFFGKDKIKTLSIEVRSDSELLIKQMQGQYKVLDPKIQPLFLQAWNLKVEYKNLRFCLISREQNKIADVLVNEALDAESKVQKLF